MLIRFSIENYLSFREEQEISLVASALKDAEVGFSPIPNSELRLLPAAIFYGANASGKSNLLSALHLLSQAVKFSHERGPKRKIPRTPFLLDKKWRSRPTKCDVEFVLHSVRYQYGFSCTDEAFLDEWLYAYPSGKRQTLYLREPKRKEMYFGKNLKGNSRTIEGLMRPNSLFLSTAAQNAHEQLTPIYNYLAGFRFKFGVQTQSVDAQTAFFDGKFDHRIIQLLKHADTGITDFRFEDMRVDSSLISDLAELFKKHITEVSVEDLTKGKRISLAHSAGDSDPVFLDLSSESSGTLRLLILFREIFLTLDQGSVLAIDEIDASLHTHLVEDIVALFNSPATNRRRAQLIATTHDTNLLCGTILRRDQIWFTEKGDTGATMVYPLTNIRTRNTDNLEKGYLEGRFGAVPFRGRLDLLVGAKDK